MFLEKETPDIVYLDGEFLLHTTHLVARTERNQEPTSATILFIRPTKLLSINLIKLLSPKKPWKLLRRSK